MKAPSIHRKEWRDLLEGKINVPIRNFFFQMKVTQAKTQIEKGIVPIETAVEELHALCEKFINAKNMYQDLQAIFGEDYETEDLKNELTANLQNQEKPETSLDEKSNDYNKTISFFKNQLEQKERELAEKNKLILTLQEELLNEKKKYKRLYEEFFKVNDNSEIFNSTKKNKKGWSFFGILKNKK